MDPLTTLGLVTNIVQLVDAATKAAKVCRDIYKDGAPNDHLRIKETSDYLHRCLSTLDRPSKPTESLSSSRSGDTLNDLSDKCCLTAQALSSELKVLQKSTKGGFRETTKKILGTYQKAPNIERLQKNLDSYHKTLDTVVAVDIRQRIIALSLQQSEQLVDKEQQFAKLLEELKSVSIPVGSKLRMEINGAVETIKQTVKIEHERTRLQIDWAAQNQDHVRQHEQFLESLRFDHINQRVNQIERSDPHTFHWILEDDDDIDTTNHDKANKKGNESEGEVDREGTDADRDNNTKPRLLHSLIDWLKQGQKIYWINGKAGSGKSTLMKFIVNDARAARALKVWANGSECTILAFYFWLSGDELQRNMKGVLCSLLHQVLLNSTSILEVVYGSDERMRQKRTIGDWSVDELEGFLKFAIDSFKHKGKICIFLDGVDEFDQKEDVGDFLDLVERLSKLQHVKFCLSSRPENYLEKRLSCYANLRLQDLTAKDIEACTRNELSKLYPANDLKETDVDSLIYLIKTKADGVFLWVRYALKNILQGIRNDDDLKDLYKRIRELPSGMEDLYREMWRRLNGDELRYQEEASMYFWYAETHPLSLFEMMVATHNGIREEYLRCLKPQDWSKTVLACEKLRSRILTRCAGLLEVNYDNGETWIPASLESLDKAKTAIASSSIAGNVSQDMGFYFNANVAYMHRTARDFLFTTDAGRNIISKTVSSRDERGANIVRAFMANILQGFSSFTGFGINGIIRRLVGLDTSYELELLKELSQICRTLSIPGSRYDIRRVTFWSHAFNHDFAMSTAWHGCTEYVQYFVDHEHEYVSPYYLGALFQRSLAGLGLALKRDTRILELARWLAQRGADLNTKHYFGYVERPIQTLLETLIESKWNRSLTLIKSPRLLRQAAQLAQACHPRALRPTSRCIMTWSIIGTHILEPILFEQGSRVFRLGFFNIEIGTDCLYSLAMSCIGHRGDKGTFAR